MIGNMQQGEISSLRRLLTIIGVLVWALAVPGALSCIPGSYSRQMETVTISESPNETRTLIYVAEERGFFAANGINVVFENYVSGAAAFSGLSKGDIDMALGAEFIVVTNALKKENIRNIATIDKFENTYIIGRIDKGINRVADLKGKRIGVPRQTSPEFFLGRFLDLNGMSIQDVTLVNVLPAEALDALTTGSLDAVAIFQPEANAIQKRLGDSAVVWPAQGGQLTYFNIVGTAAWVDSHPVLINRFLKSLVQAETYLASNPNEVKAMVQKRLKYDAAYLEAIWPNHQFSLSLDQSLIVAMEDEARWMIGNGLTTEKQVPNFVDYIHLDSLKAVKPGAVNIIR